jgi:hypothetical protein
MKQFIKYLLFLIIGIIFYILLNNREKFSIGGSNIISRTKNIKFNMVDGTVNNESYNFYELNGDLGDPIDKDSGPSIEDLSSQNTIIFFGIFKINKDESGYFGWKEKYVFISYSAVTNHFSVIYCTLNQGNIDGDELVEFNIEKTYALRSDRRSNLIYFLGRKDGNTMVPDTDRNYISLGLSIEKYIGVSFPDNKRKLELYSKVNIDKGSLILEYLSNLCINYIDCNGHGTTSGIRPNCENCVCDDPTIYTGNKCEKEFCNREDCHNHGDPRAGATREGCIDLPAEPASPEAGDPWIDGLNNCVWYQDGLRVDGTNPRCERFGGNNFGSRGNANTHCCACGGGVHNPDTRGCECVCDDPAIYTGDKCEKEFCTREDCHNHGDPRAGATRDEDCDCDCDDPVVIDTCSCLNEYGAPYDEQNCEMIMSEVAPYSNEQPIEIARRTNQYGNYCKFGSTIQYGGVQCKDLLCTDDDINCNYHGTPRGILSDDDLCMCDCEVGYKGNNCENQVDTTNFLLVPDDDMKWGSGNDIEESSFSWQCIIEDMINENTEYRNLIDTTKDEWKDVHNIVPLTTDVDDGLPKKGRVALQRFHSLLYLLNDILPDCLDNSVIIYTSMVSTSVIFTILAYYNSNRVDLLRKIKSLVVLGGAMIMLRDDRELYEPNQYNGYTDYSQLFGVGVSRDSKSYSLNYTFLNNLPVLFFNTQHGYGRYKGYRDSRDSIQFKTKLKQYTEHYQLGSHACLLPTTQCTGDASVRTSNRCWDDVYGPICKCSSCDCSKDLALQMVANVQIDLDELWVHAFHWSLQDNLYDREKMYLKILEKRSDIFQKINQPEYYPSSLEYSACSAKLKYIVKEKDPLTVDLYERLRAEQTGYFVYTLPRNTDDTIDFANLNILSINQKINDILVLIGTTVDRDKANLYKLKDFLSNLKILFKRIPDILIELSLATAICRRGMRGALSCSRCDTGSMMNLLYTRIYDIFNFSLHCEKAQDQIDDSLGISIEDRERGRHGPLENFPDLIFSLAESAVDTMFNSLFFEFDEETSKFKLLTLEESGEKINMFCSALIGALMDGGCFEGRLDAIVNLVFTNEGEFEVRIDQTVEQNVYLLINILQNYLCLNSTNSKYNTLGNNGYLQQWTVESYPDQARPRAIHWILDKFDNNLEGIINILTDNNIFGKRCSDGDFTEQAFRDVIQQAIELVSINDQDFPWGGCRGNDVVVPCFNLVDEPLDDGTTYGVNITETCRIRSAPQFVTEPEKCNYPTICTLEEGLCDGHPEVKLKPQCEEMGATWTDGSCTMNPGTGGANPDRCIYQRMEVSETPSKINNKVWTSAEYL